MIVRHATGRTTAKVDCPDCGADRLIEARYVRPEGNPCRGCAQRARPPYRRGGRPAGALPPIVRTGPIQPWTRRTEATP